MRIILAIIGMTLWWAFPVQALTPDEARHLLHRTGFGVTATQWSEIIDLNYDDAVDRILDQAMQTTASAPPAWVTDAPLVGIVQRGMNEEQRRELRITKRQRMEELRLWWFEQMLTTPAPLQERLTLFWSNHFTTEFGKIGAPMLIYRQHATLRAHALGRFDLLLHQMLHDPAMLIYLDNDKNNKKSVNENLARELMELFTLGEGHYSEQDVKQAARCLTGWGVNRQTGQFVIDHRNHDTKVKSVLGEFGNFDGDDLADVLLRRPQTAQLIVTKLWREFISMEPDDALVKKWAARLQQDDYAIAPLLNTMFKSAPFRDPANYGALIKSPVELYVGLMRPALDGLSREEKIKRVDTLRPGQRLTRLTKLAGQLLFDPPNVKGWPGGLTWIDSKTLLMREQAARSLVVGLSGNRKQGNPYGQIIPSPATVDGPTAPKPIMHYLPAIETLTAMPITHTDGRMLLDIVGDPTIHLK